MRSRVLVLALLTEACFGTGGDCTVDETGYLDPSCTEADNAGPLDGATTDSEDDMLGDVNDAVYYTAATPLGDDLSPVTVIGLPGSLASDTQVTARVAPDGPPVAALVYGRGFLVTLDARLDDTVLVTSTEGATIASLTLDDDLSVVEPPAAPEDGQADAGLVIDADVSGGGAFGGQVAVGDGDLAFIAAPYLVFHVQTGASLRVGIGDEDAVMDAEVGDELCFVALDGEKTSLSTCLLVE